MSQRISRLERRGRRTRKVVSREVIQERGRFERGRFEREGRGIFERGRFEGEKERERRRERETEKERKRGGKRKKEKEGGVAFVSKRETIEPTEQHSEEILCGSEFGAPSQIRRPDRSPH